MDTKELRSRKRHARRLAMEALDRAGSRTAVARALGVARATISHECTSRPNRTLEGFFDLFLNVNACPDAAARAIADAVNEALEVRDIISADTETLVERGVYLVEQENRLDALEDTASLRSTLSHAAAGKTHASALFELAAIEHELLVRRVDLLAVYRERQS